MAEVTLVPRKDVDRDDWNSFVDRSDAAWLWHRQELIDALLTWPGSSDASVAAVRPGGEIVAVVPLLGWRRPAKGIVTFVDLESFGAPALASDLGRKERRAVVAAIDEHFKRTAAESRAVQLYLLIPPLAPAYCGERAPRVNPLLELGFKNTLTQTWMVDLRLSEKDLRARYSETARQEVRKAADTGLTIRPAEGQRDLETYYGLHVETYKRTGAKAHPKSYFEIIFRTFLPAGFARLLVAEADGIVVAAQNTAFYKNAAYYWTSASSAEAPAGANRALMHRQIMSARADGALWYDTGEAFPGQTGTKQAGLNSFKRSFGGEQFPLYRGHRRFPGLRTLLAQGARALKLS